LIISLLARQTPCRVIFSYRNSTLFCDCLVTAAPHAMQLLDYRCRMHDARGVITVMKVITPVIADGRADMTWEVIAVCWWRG